MSPINTLAWPAQRLGEALDVLATRAGITTNNTSQDSVINPDPAIDLTSEEKLDHWLNWAASKLHIEVERVETTAAQFRRFLRHSTPTLLRFWQGGQPAFLLLLKAGRRHAILVSPQLKKVKYPLEPIRAALWSAIEEPAREQLQSLVEHAGIPRRQWPRVTSALLTQKMAPQRFAGCWLIRMPPSTSFPSQLADDGIRRRILAMVTAFSCLYLLELIGWSLIGWGALAGRFDPGWLLAWALLLLSMAPIQLWGNWLQGSLAVQIGTLLKKRLLAGALAMKMDTIRRQGVGQLLGRVIESQAIDALALNGGFTVLIAAIELGLASVILVLGAGGIVHALLLWLCLLAAGIVGKRYYLCLRRWTQSRLQLTHDLIERMVGHRTRLAQEPPHTRHGDEDQMLEDYLHQSQLFDQSVIPLAGGLPRGWLIIGLLGLAPNFVFGNADVVGLAIGLGGVLLAYRALGSVVSGLSGLSRAHISWEQVDELFYAAEHIEKRSSVQPKMRLTPIKRPIHSPQSLLQMSQLKFTYARQHAPVINQCDLIVHHGDRILLEGPSGCGKSTLAALLVGLRKPDSGLLLLNGLDRATWGSDWRQLTTAAPQFHENHVLSGTLAFNLLMGRNWPPSDADLTEAQQLCVDLGLGDLLNRMPGGLMQTVGETGWQLSHGERSRVYLARALLQNAELVVLDESFAALDPATLLQCITTALARAPTLMVIAHK